MFYGINGKKRVPLGALKFFTPLTAKIWYFDDGSIQERGRRITFSTYCFDNASLKVLLKCLDKIGVNGELSKEPKGTVIVLRDGAVLEFLDIIGRGGPQCVKYKLKRPE